MFNEKRRLKEPLKLKFKLRFLVAFLGLAIVGFASYASMDKWPLWMAEVEEFVAKAIDAKVEHIMVSGVKNTKKQDMADALALRKGDSLVGFDAANARARLESLPWIRDAVVERQLPDSVLVRVYEFVPVARLLMDGETWVVNKAGNRITKAKGEFEELTLVRGEGAEEHAADLIVLLNLEVSGALPKIAEATYIGSRRWNLGFNTGSYVLLPEKNPAHAMRILTKLQKAESILNIDGAVVDLRLEDRIVLRMPPNTKKKERSL